MIGDHNTLLDIGRKQTLKRILASGIWGTVTGFALSLLFAFLLVSLFLIFFVVTGENDISTGIRFLVFNTLLFGLGITGIPSGIIGLVTGLIIGLILSRQRTELARLNAGIVGLAVSIVLTILIILVMIITDSISYAAFLFPLAIIYIVGSYIFGVFVYRRIFAASIENAVENH